MFRKLKRTLKHNAAILKVYKTARQIIKITLKVLLNIIGYVFIAPFSLIVPKKNQVVLTSRFGDFEGNLKYLFLYLNDLEHQETEFIFLTDKGKVFDKLNQNNLKVWKYPKISTLFKLLTVKVVIVDGNEWASRFKPFFLIKAKKVQIWHGTGLKTIGLLKPTYQKLSKLHKAVRKESICYDLVALSSDYQVQTRGKAFNYKDMLVNGLPRNDIFFNENFLKRGLTYDGSSIEKYKRYKEEGYKLVTYTPTWRKHQNDLYQLDLDKLNEFVKKYNIKFILKLHYKHQCNLQTKNLENIIEYDKYADIYPLLAITDLLITDYSSIYLDYLLLNKPIVFYPYDSKEYIDGERALLLDYDKTTPGAKVYSQEQLQREIHKTLNEKDQFKEERLKMQRQFFNYADGNSSQRLWHYIKENFL
ncbi:CDP-glycerol glycerophosphotransferase family protein [Proteinivorax tanatarense]|uniref:CDP-glycerol glycerophosphotransferase family protein n=1 Tax=Proteinivorax tanatarense TaxID=1260629 RepID=A0AAU7VHQ1_9FIRM